MSVAGVSITRIAPRPQDERRVGGAPDIGQAARGAEDERFVRERVVESGRRDPFRVATEGDERDEFPDPARQWRHDVAAIPRRGADEPDASRAVEEFGWPVAERRMSQ